MKFSLKPNIFLIEVQPGLAVFYWFGSRFYLRRSYIEPAVLKFVLEQLSGFITRDQLTAAAVKQGLSDSATASCLTDLLNNGYLQELQESDFIVPDFDLHDPLHHFLAKFLGSNLGIDKVRRDLEKSDLLLLNTGAFAPAILEALAMLGLRRIVLLDGDAVSSADISGAPTIFKPADIGADRGPRLVQEFKGKIALVHSRAEDIFLRDHTFCIGLGHWYDLAALLKFNVRAASEGKAWLLVLQDYFGGTIGPYLGRPGAPCLNCVLLRRQVNLTGNDHQDLTDRYFSANRQHLAHFGFSPFNNMLAQVVVVEVLKLLTKVMPSKTLFGAYEIDALNHRNSHHPILAFPYCEICRGSSRSPDYGLEV